MHKSVCILKSLVLSTSPNLLSSCSQTSLAVGEKRTLWPISLITALRSQEITILSQRSHWPTNGEVAWGLVQLPKTKAKLIFSNQSHFYGLPPMCIVLTIHQFTNENIIRIIRRMQKHDMRRIIDNCFQSFFIHIGHKRMWSRNCKQESSGQEQERRTINLDRKISKDVTWKQRVEQIKKQDQIWSALLWYHVSLLATEMRRKKTSEEWVFLYYWLR